MGHKPACWLWNSRRQTHGYVNARTALMVSCNYYYYEVASRMGIDTLAAYAKKFGLGEKTGIEIYGLNLKVSRCLIKRTDATRISTVKEINIVSKVLRSIC